ncbi:MAG: SagB/ThcOx family dehydrogenase [Methanoregula sp.]|nr:SagB/ThcOx family dehydrogenase [Methanoregula sp.]
MLPTGHTFMEQTRYEYLSASDQAQELPAPPLEKAVPEGITVIPLPRPENITVPPVDCRTAIEKRRSIRHYTRSPLTLEELSFLCWSTQGIVEVKAPYYTLRNVPSAGGRHAFETYLLINRVADLPSGLYRYLAFSHNLVPVDTKEGVVDRVMAACLGQAFVRSSAVTFIWSAVIYRMAWRYSERAYRLVHLDAGHVCQNLYLAGEQIECGTCAIGAFDDQQIADVLGIDGEEEFVVYCASVGKKTG